jgi:hypothetical protein
MLDDPIVEEVRKARQEYAAKFDYDLRSIFLDIKRQEAEYRKRGWKVISSSSTRGRIKRTRTGQPSLNSTL